MARHIPLVLATLVAIFLIAPILIIVPMSFSTSISFEFPPPGYWLGYYVRYFHSDAWLSATANSFIIAFGSMVLTMLVALPAAFGCVRGRGGDLHRRPRRLNAAEEDVRKHPARIRP